NEAKILEDAQWDGLKGYLTNTELDMENVIRQYHGLWVVERAFRIGKGQLEMWPMFHFTERRIEAHICICFVAYKMYKELERKIRQLEIPMSVDKVLNIAKTITTIRLKLPNGELYTETLYTTPQQETIRPLIEP
ncbi:MAG: transposase, partial [Bacteroidales bacterium]|nr:transposase [Bacteroidales bacterium]